MSLIEDLKTLGADVEDGLDRVMGDSDLYEMMLGMFIDSVEVNPVDIAAFDSGDLTELTEKVHMLKGVTGNLALTPLFNSYTEVLGLLRGCKAAEAKARYQEMLPAQEKVLDCIKKYKA